MNRLHLKASIDILRLLTLQTYPLRGHEESNDFESLVSFFEFRKVLAEYNVEIAKGIDNAHYNAKQPLHILVTEVPN